MVTKREATQPLTWPDSKMTGEVKPHDVDNAANFMGQVKIQG